MFSYGELSHSDIIDVLCENNIYREQDFAAQLVSNGWTELRRRTKSMGVSSPYEFNPSRYILQEKLAQIFPLIAFVYCWPCQSGMEDLGAKVWK